MSENRDEDCFAVLLRLAGVSAAGNEDQVVVATLLGQGRALLGADGAAVILEDHDGRLRVAGATGSGSRAVAEAGLRDGGPAQFAHHGQHVVSFVIDDPRLWPCYAAEATRQGIRVVHAVPIAVGNHALGVYALHWTENVHLSYQDEHYARSLARMAAVGLVNGQQMEDHDRRADQLQHALDSRVVIEQAKGMIAARAGVDPGSAFDLIRATARASGRTLAEVAEEVVRGIASMRDSGQCWEDQGPRESARPRSRRFRVQK